MSQWRPRIAGSAAGSAPGTPLSVGQRALQRRASFGSHNGARGMGQGTPVGTPRRGARRAAKPRRAFQPRLLGLWAWARSRRWSPGAPWSGLADRLRPRRPRRRLGVVVPGARPRVGAVACLFLCLMLFTLLLRRVGILGPDQCRRTGTEPPARSAVGEPADELQPRPGLVDRGDLHVDEAELEAEVADHVLVQVAGQAEAFCAAFLGQHTQTMPAVEVRSNSTGSRRASAAYDVWKVSVTSAARGRRRTTWAPFGRRGRARRGRRRGTACGRA